MRSSGMQYIDVNRMPDIVNLQRGETWVTARREGDAFLDGDVHVRFARTEAGTAVLLGADGPLSRAVLRWRHIPPDANQRLRVMGDHWERGYGDLFWGPLDGGRDLPWYLLYGDDDATHAAGVQTGPSAICYWRLDAFWLTLVVDVRNGGSDVYLHGRELTAAVLVGREGIPGETAFEAARKFCRLLCPMPLLPASPVYGGNNWYFAYGKSSHAEILRDSRLIAGLSEGLANRPFMVIDMNWHSSYADWAQTPRSPWSEDNPAFPDMAGLSREMKATGVRPGLWFRPLITSCATPREWLLEAGRVIGQDAEGLILDPSVPEALALIAGYVRRFASWGYELVKYDFTAYDMLGRWGFMPKGFTDDAWSFRDRSRTTAEIVLALYRTIYEAAGDMLLIGCNTLSHLAAGLVHIQRTGDDTSGREWERTRKMGINTLAFRMPQHETFYAADADCVPITPAAPWALTGQWLSLVAESGTPLFVSADPRAMGDAERRAVAAAFQAASGRQSPAVPLDWEANVCPARWKTDGGMRVYDWTDVTRFQYLGL